MNRIGALVPCLLLLTCYLHAETSVLVTLRLTKTEKAPDRVPLRIAFPAGCDVCSVVNDPGYARQNAREAILAIRIPVSQAVSIDVITDARAFRRVSLETMDIPFTADTHQLRLTVPPQVADRVNSGEFQTHLYWPGIELRIEHADPERRAGDYASGSFPDVQRKAATNLEFGLLEAIRGLGLGHYVDDQNLGRLFLMGFDTNYPHGHHDFPPHFHLALWLPNYRGGGSLIPHFYIDSRGLIEDAIVTPYDWPTKPSEYKAGEKFTAVDMLARPVFSMTITSKGWLNFSRFDGAECSLVPLERGFDNGVKVTCPNFPAIAVSVEDDMMHGEVRESIDGKVAHVFHYDTDTGVLQ